MHDGAEFSEDAYAKFLAQYVRVLETGAVPAMGERFDSETRLVVDLDVEFTIEGGVSEKRDAPAHVCDEAFLRRAVEAFRAAYLEMCDQEPENQARARAAISRCDVMQRPSPYLASSQHPPASTWKGGVHLVFLDMRVTAEEARAICERVVENDGLDAALSAAMERASSRLPAGKTMQVRKQPRGARSIVDAGIYGAARTWQMYGSSKPGVPPYLTTWEVSGDEWSPVSSAEARNWTARVPRATVWRVMGDAYVECGEPIMRTFLNRTKPLHGAPPDARSQTLVCHQPAGACAKEVAKALAVLPLLSSHRASDYTLWRNVGLALHHTASLASCTGSGAHAGCDRLLAAWTEWSRRSPKHAAESAAACSQAWQSFGRTSASASTASAAPITLGSLIAWAREDSGRDEADSAVAQALCDSGSAPRPDHASKQTPNALVADHDLDAAQKLLQSDSVRGRVCRCGTALWIRTETGTWSSDADTVQRTLMKLCQHSGIVRKDSRGNVMPYAQMVGHARNIVAALRNEAPEDPTFEERLRTSSQGKLFFSDGVYDFFTRTFRAYADEDLAEDLTTVRVPHAYPRDEDRSAQLEEEVWSKVFRKIFGHGEGDAECFLQHVARGLAGMYEDKHWVVCQADRNSGKGVVEHLLKSAFGSGYVGTVNSEALLMSRGGLGAIGADEAKRLSWLVKVCRSRLIFAKEMPMADGLVINGALIKGKLASGGDPVLARKNYSDEMTIVNESRFFLFVNETPTIEPADATEFMHAIPMPFRFVSADTLKHLRDERGDDDAVALAGFREGDHGVKRWCSQRAVCDAAIRIILDAFTPHPVVPSASVLAETTKCRGACGGARDELAMLWSMFAGTNSASDVVHNSSLMKRVRAFKLKLSRDKIRQQVEKMGGKWSNNAVDASGKRSRGYTNLRVVADFRPDDSDVGDAANLDVETVPDSDIAGSVGTASTRTRDWVGGIGEALP